MFLPRLLAARCNGLETVQHAVKPVALHPAHRAAHAGEPLLRPHARLPLPGQDRTRRPAVRGPDRHRVESRTRSGTAVHGLPDRHHRSPAPTSCRAPTPARATRTPTRSCSAAARRRVPPVATMSGFVTNFAAAITFDEQTHRGSLPGHGRRPTSWASSRPSRCRCMSGLARGFAVCDHWYSSVPTETFPNRAFACAATSQGHMNDATASYTVQSIFGLMTAHNLSWKIYGYNAEPLTRANFPDTQSAPDTNFGKFADFQADCAAGTLPAVQLPGAELGLDRQQPAPELRRRARRGADPAGVPGGARRSRLGPDAADHHLRRARRPVRPRAAARGRGAAGRLPRRVRLRLHPVRRPGARRPGVAADRGGHDLQRAGRQHADRPHLRAQDDRGALGAAEPDRARRGRARPRRRAHADDAAHRRPDRRRGRAGVDRPEPGRRRGLAPAAAARADDLEPAGAGRQLLDKPQLANQRTPQDFAHYIDTRADTWKAARDADQAPGGPDTRPR